MSASGEAGPRPPGRRIRGRPDSSGQHGGAGRGGAESSIHLPDAKSPQTSAWGSARVAAWVARPRGHSGGEGAG